MRFATIERQGFDEPAVVVGGGLLGLGGAGFADVLSLIAGGKDAMDRVHRWVHAPQSSEVTDMAKVRLRAPVPRPPKIICIGLNYRDHAAEAKMAIPEVPTVFSKYAMSVTGHNSPIVLPKNSAKPDYEAEFAVVIGQGGRHIREDRWREHVFGYTIVNDVSARDFQMATSQWMMGKTFDTFCPMGPVVVTADEIADPHNLRISLRLNGEVLQDSNTRNLIFGVGKLIAFLSSVFTLEPGDVISTGTPAGVGFARKPPVWLKAGDEVAVEVEGIGTLVNPVVAEQ
ncbi:MAG TPA: fumarylacetoacetate hydrolase family protein [Bryobacteraceae bacterium]|nr:fumarylacetoacetate hydrolase family protein [Bryobacteraceae bacterium]